MAPETANDNQPVMTVLLNRKKSHVLDTSAPSQYPFRGRKDTCRNYLGTVKRSKHLYFGQYNVKVTQPEYGKLHRAYKEQSVMFRASPGLLTGRVETSETGLTILGVSGLLHKARSASPNLSGDGRVRLVHLIGQVLRVMKILLPNIEDSNPFYSRSLWGPCV
jgi:hypothetical protein